MEKLILELFEKQKSRPGDMLMMRNIEHGLLSKLNPKEQAKFEPALKNLIKEDIIEFQHNRTDTIWLTENGYKELYADSRNIEQIKGLIMEMFAKQNSRSGDILTMSNLNHGLLQSFNPKESDLFGASVEELLTEKLVTYEATGLKCLRLTDKGFKGLY